jgi:GAF domain-containing protein
MNTPFVPYPVDLARLERRAALPPSQLNILALRRFADPSTGEWETTTGEIAELVGVSRPATQKALWALQRQRYLYFYYVRGRTVRVVVMFGGFPAPAYRGQGRLALQWNSDFPKSAIAPRGWDRQPIDFSLILKLAHSHVLSNLDKGRIHLRANILVPIAKERLKVTYDYHMDGDPDRGLEFVHGSGAAGWCWQTGRPVVCDLADARQTFRTKWRMTDAQQERVRPTLKSLLSVPIFAGAGADAAPPNDRVHLLGVLSFDSDEDLLSDFRRPHIQRAAAECATLAAAHLPVSKYEGLPQTLFDTTRQTAKTRQSSAF